MKQSIGLLALAIAALQFGRIAIGDAVVLAVAHGAMALMALMIAGTFLWLWLERATPLALGMAFSWLGAGVFGGWWWLAERAGAVAWVPGAGGVSALLSLCLVGAGLHFAVIHRSFGRHGASFLWPVLAAFAASALAYAAL